MIERWLRRKLFVGEVRNIWLEEVCFLQRFGGQSVVFGDSLCEIVKTFCPRAEGVRNVKNTKAARKHVRLARFWFS